MWQFCDKETGKITEGTKAEAIEWISKNYNEVETMIESMSEHPGEWYNGMFRDCRYISGDGF